MKNILRMLRNTVLIILCVLLLFLTAVFVFHRIMLAREKPRIGEPLGKMVEVDGGNMCVYTAGQGTHTLVFLSGYGTPSPILDFKPLYEKLQDDYRIAVVEKFGYGFSDETDLPRDMATMLRETREALTKAGVQAPYILVPHSASGFESMYWAQNYPEEIEGIAALDAAIPGYHDAVGYSIFLDRMVKVFADTGLIRFLDNTWEYACNSPYYNEPERAQEQAQFMALLHARRGSATILREAEYLRENVAAVAAKPAPDVPMIFFISEKMAALIFPENPDKYFALYRDYTDNRAQYIGLDCGHYVHVQDTERVAAEIRRFTAELDAAA